METYEEVELDAITLTDENGEDLLETIEDDDEFERVADAFEDRFLSELDLDEGQDS